MKKPEREPLQLLARDPTELEEYIAAPPTRFIPSGLPPLDDLILGAISTELTLIAGQPGDGKTSLAAQWAVAGAQNGTPTMIHSLEMSPRALLDRLISGRIGVDFRDIIAKRLTKKQWDQYRDWNDFFRQIPLYSSGHSAGVDGQAEYNNIIRWAKEGIGFVLIDYIQQMTGANESRVTQVGDAVRAIKSGAKDADIPVIALSALNRGAGGDVPKKSHLRDSGDLEFVADTIIMFHYPNGAEDAHERERPVDIHVVKQRNGPTGIASAVYQRHKTLFVPMDGAEGSVL